MQLNVAATVQSTPDVSPKALNIFLLPIVPKCLQPYVAARRMRSASAILYTFRTPVLLSTISPVALCLSSTTHILPTLQYSIATVHRLRNCTGLQSNHLQNQIE